MPPPYNGQQNASQRSGRQEINHNRDSRGSDQPDDVRLLPGSEPTTPSDISKIIVRFAVVGTTANNAS